MTKPQKPKQAISRSVKISHTLDPDLHEQLEEFAAAKRISKSSIIEDALRIFFERGYDSRLGRLLQRGGLVKPRKPAVEP
jgi:Ribbon-helix-helix protein, copG family